MPVSSACRSSTDTRIFSSEQYTSHSSTVASTAPTQSAPQKPTQYAPFYDTEPAFAADPIVLRMTKAQLQKSIDATTQLMKEAAKNLDFIQAAQYRDEIVRLQQQLEAKTD